MRQNDSLLPPRDHGGGLDHACALYGGSRGDWLDLSTGINPVPYPIGDIELDDWTALPDSAAQLALLDAARMFWTIPEGADILAAPGASSIIAAIPTILSGATVSVPTPTYNEHAAAFMARQWTVSQDQNPDVTVLVHPNNPDGRLWSEQDLNSPQMVIDESFADTCPDRTLITHAKQPGHLVLKSFGKFWGLAGLRLGFAIGPSDLTSELRNALGPWAVSGPALRIGARALRDVAWAHATRMRLAEDAQRLDALMIRSGARALGGTTLFRLYDTANAAQFQDRLAQSHIWSRIFPYSDHWVRLGLPAPTDWARLETALAA